MKWEKIGERENDFLKNYLFYESLIDVFPKAVGMRHPDFLTIRDGIKYSHYINKESSNALAVFILGRIKNDPGFMELMFEEAKKHFGSLINFCLALGDLKAKNNAQLSELIKEYSMLYKEAYPYFLMNIEAGAFEKENAEHINDAINSMAKLRLYCRANFNRVHELIYSLFDEIARRHNTSADMVKFLTHNEIQALLNGENVEVDKLVAQRSHCVFIYSGGEKFQLFENTSMAIEENENGFINNELKGRGTFPAYYKGKVRIIRNPEDMNSLKGGEVIVLRMTTTDLITASLKKAGAIITDEGGITCHAAVISREFGIPCIIGTRIATKVLKDGDFVEIDAEKGIVKLRR